MNTSVADLEAQAMRLAPEERASLADKLLSSLPTNSDTDLAWFQEAERRLAELENGVVQGVPVEGAIARARAAIQGI